MTTEEGLQTTLLELITSARELASTKRLTAATILYSKALFALLGYIILREYQKIPKNHAERFRILRQKFPRLYPIVDEVWSTYTDTYSQLSNEEAVTLLTKALMEVASNYENLSATIQEALTGTTH